MIPTVSERHRYSDDICSDRHRLAGRSSTAVRRRASGERRTAYGRLLLHWLRWNSRDVVLFGKVFQKLNFICSLRSVTEKFDHINIKPPAHFHTAFANSVDLLPHANRSSRLGFLPSLRAPIFLSLFPYFFPFPFLTFFFLCFFPFSLFVFTSFFFPLSFFTSFIFPSAICFSTFFIFPFLSFFHFFILLSFFFLLSR